jgi:hypothetical protein
VKLPSLSLALVAAILGSCVGAEGQVSLPPVNLGETSFQDGIAYPGWLVQEISQYYHATKWKNANGTDMSGANSANTFSSVSHVAYIDSHRILGGFYAAEVLLPVADVHLETSFGPNDRENGIGDLIVGPVGFQWNNTKMLRRPCLQRFLLDVIVPTGEYSDRRAVNIGNHVVSLNPYYAFTFSLPGKLEFSGRLHYLWNSENNDPFVGLQAKNIQPGQALHQNFSGSYELHPGFRAGLNGYALEQITDHKLDGKSLANSHERVFAIGPGVQIQAAKGFFIYMNSYFETGVRNRPQGAAFGFRLSKVFGGQPKRK